MLSIGNAIVYKYVGFEYFIRGLLIVMSIKKS